MKKKILIVTPKFPYPKRGACEQDRAAGIERLIDMGHEVEIITKIYNLPFWKQALKDTQKKLNVNVTSFTYIFHGKVSLKKKIKKIMRQFLYPPYLDGAAYEYTDKKMKNALKKSLESFQPDIVWFDYTYLWPLYKMVKKKGIPIITRSMNIEAFHFLEENGWSPINIIKFLPKIYTEKIICRDSDVLLAITPKEYDWYKKYCQEKLLLLPLRALPEYIKNPHKQNKTKKVLDVFFSGSTYNVPHNRAALEFVVNKVAPLAEEKFPGQFHFNIFGGKVPKSILKIKNKNITIFGYTNTKTYRKNMDNMDIALIPSLYGSGMQQKIFEPIVCGFPTITSPRGIAGYHLKDGEHVLLADTPKEFVSALGKLKNVNTRNRIALAAREKTKNIFSQLVIDEILNKAIKKATS